MTENQWHGDEPVDLFETPEQTAERLSMEERADRFSAFATDAVLGALALAVVCFIALFTAKLCIWLWHVI